MLAIYIEDLIKCTEELESSLNEQGIEFTINGFFVGARRGLNEIGRFCCIKDCDYNL